MDELVLGLSATLGAGLTAIASGIWVVIRRRYVSDILKERERHEQALHEYVRSVASLASTADELAKLAQLRDDGIIAADEFESQKAKLLD